MEKWSFKPRDLVTVPNLITYIRFLLVPPFIYFFLKENYVMAGVMVGLSGLSDCFDGYFARKLDQVTSLGKILDPIADKVTLISVAVCMVIYMPAILPIMMVLVTKEFLMLLGGFLLLLCKVATVIFYFVICLIIFIKILTGQENMLLVYIGLAMIIALIQYGVVFFRLIKAKNDEKK